MEQAEKTGDDFVNIQFKEGKSGNLYAEVNNWKPSSDGETSNSVQQNDNDVPF